MKKTTLLTILSLTALALSACGAASASGSTSPAGSLRNGAARNLPLTPQAKLALGTIELEGTPEAVDASMAAKLLPLWQLMAQLNSSSSTAPQEVTAVLNQIQATMNPNQVKTISSMKLTSADIFTAFQGQGQASQTGGTGSTTDPGGAASGARRGQGGGGGFFFGGGGPGGGGLGGTNRNGTGTNGTGSTTSPAQAAQQASNQISLILVNQVVRLLETRIKS